MTLSEDVNLKEHTITVKGTKKELKEFIHCVDEALTKNALKNEIDQKIAILDKTNEEQIINFTMYHQARMSKEKIILITDKINRKFYFSLIKQANKEALRLYNEKNEKK